MQQQQQQQQQQEVKKKESAAGENGAKSPGDPQCSSTKDTTTKGRHRITVELNKLHQEAKFLQEELDQLEKTEGVSTLCPQLLQTVESIADPLLPITGQCNQSWDRWFRGPFDSHGSGCQIL